MEPLLIRPIHKTDNARIAACIRTILEELGVPRTGTAYADTSLDQMYEYYQMPGAVYYVVARGDQVLGGGGIAPLEGGAPSVCELQKMYLSEALRGMGMGTQLLQKCLHKATEFGYAQCYIETMPYMEAAQALYRKFGFTYLREPMGQTGHTSCKVWMLRSLKNPGSTE